MVVHTVTDGNIADIRAFLERHAETALFLLSNLASHGPSVGNHLNSGDFKCVESDGAIVAVFCLNRRGTLLVEAAARTDCARLIVDACHPEAIAIEGVIGEWRSAQAVWNLLEASGEITPRYASKEVLQQLDLRTDNNRVTSNVRYLAPDDFWQWEPMNRIYLSDEGLPLQGTLEERRAEFETNARARRWWGYFDEGQLVSTSALNAVYKTMGQIGGVHTMPARRRQGLSRATMQTLIADATHDHALQQLILFTGEKNVAARRLYASLGFAEIGNFALLFGTPTSARRGTCADPA